MHTWSNSWSLQRNGQIVAYAPSVPTNTAWHNTVSKAHQTTFTTSQKWRLPCTFLQPRDDTRHTDDNIIQVPGSKQNEYPATIFSTYWYGCQPYFRPQRLAKGMAWAFTTTRLVKPQWISKSIQPLGNLNDGTAIVTSQNSTPPVLLLQDVLLPYVLSMFCSWVKLSYKMDIQFEAQLLYVWAENLNSWHFLLFFVPFALLAPFDVRESLLLLILCCIPEVPEKAKE